VHRGQRRIAGSSGIGQFLRAPASACIVFGEENQRKAVFCTCPLQIGAADSDAARGRRCSPGQSALVALVVKKSAPSASGAEANAATKVQHARSLLARLIPWSAKPWARTMRALCLLGAVILGCLIVVRKGEAQPQPPALPLPTGRTVGVPGAVPLATARAVGATSAGPLVTAPASTSAAPSAPSTASTVAASDASATPLDDTVVQTDQDFPPDMSREEREALGTGKVPIHREGQYRSPLAHPRFGGATHAKVGLVIDEVRDYNIQTGSFEAEFFISFTGDKDLPKLDLAYPNGHEVECAALTDAPTFKLFRCSGKFTSEVDLRLYPFDRQNLTIQVEDKRAGIDQITFEADPRRTSLNSEFRMSGYSVATVGARAYSHLYPPRFDRDDLYISRYKFVLGIDRFATSAAFSVFVPAFIIVIISLMGIWVPPDELEVRSNAGAPMLAAAVLFHFSLTQGLPATGYLTRADKLMLGVYVSLLLNMATTWAFLIVDEDRRDIWFKRFRAFVPPLTGAVMAAASMV
jgi:hypothetical protein